MREQGVAFQKRMRQALVAGAVAIATLMAIPMPGAVGAQPYMDPRRGGVSEGVRAGTLVETVVFKGSKFAGCGFTESVQFTSGGIDWFFFSRGAEVSVSNARINITNVESGISYLQTSNYHRTVTTRSDGTQLIVIDGSRWMDFFAGEPGPYGTVGPGGHEYFVTGLQSMVYDPKKDAILSYSVTGQVLDACELLT
jgi:hypothetical protein